MSDPSDELAELREEVERLTRERDEANARAEKAKAAHERLLLALRMIDGPLRRIHQTPMRELLMQWGIDEKWADDIDAALAKERA